MNLFSICFLEHLIVQYGPSPVDPIVLRESTNCPAIYMLDVHLLVDYSMRENFKDVPIPTTATGSILELL